MLLKNTKLDWENYFADRGLTKEHIASYLAYIAKLNKNNVPVIFEFEHLAKLLGLKMAVLAGMVNSTQDYYRTFSIPKKRGGTREIQAPYPSLLEAQKWIYRHILRQQPVNICAHGFVRNKSIFSNAENHVGKKTLLKMDIKNFFSSIPKNWIIQFFQQLGYAPNVAFYLASLCCYEDALGQGAATSPCLSNIVCRHLDNRLSLVASSYDLTYTRYADDIAFSGDYIPHSMIDLIAKIITECGFRVNEEKTILSAGAGKRILTGLSIAGDHIQIPRNYKRQIKSEAHYVIKYGFFSHASKTKIRNPFYLESLLGKLQFWVKAEPNNEVAKEYCAKIRAIRQALS